jgi:hypothetical protein
VESTYFLGILMVGSLTANSGKSTAPQFQEIADPVETENDADDIAWATRSGMWQNRVAKASARRTKRARAQPALILAGHGVSLRVEGGALTIQNGFTHYPQQREIIRYFRGDVALPSASLYWTAAAAFRSMSCRGSPSKRLL